MQKIECRQTKWTKFHSILEPSVRASPLFFFFLMMLQNLPFRWSLLLKQFWKLCRAFNVPSTMGIEKYARGIYPFGLASSCHLRKVNFDGAIMLILSSSVWSLSELLSHVWHSWYRVLMCNNHLQKWTVGNFSWVPLFAGIYCSLVVFSTDFFFCWGLFSHLWAAYWAKSSFLSSCRIWYTS